MSPIEGLPPVPDPTILTTEQLLREVERVKELMMAEIKGLTATVNEKFRSVDEQLELVERQRVEQKQDTKAAVDAALTAQKEAVREQTAASERAIAKSEAATTKQIEQLSATITTAIKGVSDLLSDTKDRVGKVESLKQGGDEKLTGIYAMVGFVLTVLIIGGIVAAAGGFK